LKKTKAHWVEFHRVQRKCSEALSDLNFFAAVKEGGLDGAGWSEEGEAC
jgi:hypothetical protein